MKKKNGFTLIELLAVIIILGILMIIAIPSVTRYISDSRKSAYVDTAKEIIGGARNIVNGGKLEMYSTNTTYYIPVECIKTENALKSPYGDFIEGGAYVGVIYDGKGYNYYWISVDDAGQGVRNITRLDKLDTDDIESDLNKSDITDVVESTGIGNRTEINILKCSNNTWDPIMLSNTSHNVSEEGGTGGSGSDTTPTAVQTISALTTLEDVADAKRFVGANPSNYVKFNGNELWRIIGVYGNKLKIIKANETIGNIKHSNSSESNVWNGCYLQNYLNNDYYNSLSTTAKDMIETDTWYVGPGSYTETASQNYTRAKNVSWTGKVGIIATYEYLYAASNDCYNTTAYDYSSSCYSKDWIYLNNASYTWMITPFYENSVEVLYIRSGGGLLPDGMSVLHGVYPVVYLKSSVKITGGTGMSSDPYTLGL